MEALISQSELHDEEIGLKEGAARSFLHVLAHRFGMLPEGLSERVQNATPEDLDRWTDRVLDAGSLAEVFRDPH
ncbi:DUF4351 domain-containing protein [Ruegeria atlantica]|uniref:DUF4351 domain-containing protein n=1 Tax=Ruegeria atlantica TaxID=81569 RepID=UPI00147CB053|nr:DUF4351 domain-containing protein [Ruegeria atlantica]